MAHESVRSEDIKTPPAIFSFAHGLFETRETDSGRKQYQVTLHFPKSTNLGALQSLVLATAKKAWPGKPVEDWIKDGTIKNPFLDGDGKQGKNNDGDPKPGHAGTTFIRCASGADYRPKVVDQHREVIYEKSAFPSGSRGYAVVNCYSWDNPTNGKGISFGIGAAQLIHKAEGDEVLGGGGGVDTDKHFETIPDDGPSEGSSPTADAASLFG